jgi:hypothetical protein
MAQDRLDDLGLGVSGNDLEAALEGVKIEGRVRDSSECFVGRVIEIQLDRLPFSRVESTYGRRIVCVVDLGLSEVLDVALKHPPGVL